MTTTMEATTKKPSELVAGDRFYGENSWGVALGSAEEPITVIRTEGPDSDNDYRVYFFTEESASEVYKFFKSTTDLTIVSGEPVVPDSRDAEIQSLTTQLEHAQQDVRNLRRRLGSFEDQVREKAIEVADEQNWCREGLNSALEDLGLEPVNSEFYVDLTVRVLVEDVNDEDEAGDTARESIASSGYSVTIEDVNIDSVEPVDG